MGNHGVVHPIVCGMSSPAGVGCGLAAACGARRVRRTVARLFRLL